MTPADAATLIRMVAAQVLLNPQAVREQDPKALDAVIEAIITRYQNIKPPFIKKEE